MHQLHANAQRQLATGNGWLAKTGDPAQPDQSLQVSSSLGSTTLGQYLGTAQTEVTVPDITIEPSQLPEGLVQDTVSIFSEMYKQHLSQLLEAVVLG